MNRINQTLLHILAPSLLIFLPMFVCSSAWGDKERSENRKILLDKMSEGEATGFHEDRSIKCGTPFGLVANQLLDQLDPAQRAKVASALAAPVLPFSYDSPSGYFKIHYATSGSDAVLNSGVDVIGALGAPGADGVPDYVNATADIFDSVKMIILGDIASGFLQYPPPPNDFFFTKRDMTLNPDSLYDIYVHNLGQLKIFGATFRDELAPFHFDSISPFASYTSYIEIDNDYIEDIFSFVNDYKARPLDAVRVTAAHEFFHAIHFGIDAFEAEEQSVNGPLRLYWFEMSSVSMEEYIYDDINDYYGYLINLPTPFDHAYKSLQTAGANFTEFGLFHYSMGVFPIYLNEKFGPMLMRGIWRGCGRQGPDFLMAADSAIIAHTSSAYNLSSVLQEFGIWCVFSGSRAKFAPPGMRFDEAEFYPDAVPFFKTKLVNGQSVVDTLIHDSYPFLEILVSGSGRASPDINANTFIALENTFAVGNNCFKPFVDVAISSILNGVSPRLAMVGIPYDGVSTAYVDTISYRTNIIDTIVVVPAAIADSVIAAFLSAYSCYDSFSVVRSLTDPDSLHEVVINGAPSLVVPDPDLYEPVIMIVTQTSTDLNLYGTRLNPANYPFAYGVFDSSIIPIDTPSVQPFIFFSGFPNPVLPGDNQVTIGVAKNRTVFSSGGRRMRATVFTEIGEKLFVEEAPITAADSIKVIWGLDNMSGRRISSGVYLVLQELIGPTGEIELSQVSKLLVIRQ